MVANVINHERTFVFESFYESFLSFQPGFDNSANHRVKPFERLLANQHTLDCIDDQKQVGFFRRAD